MYFCYVDESGYGSEPILVMAGVIVDATRMHKTKSEWNELILKLSDRINRPIEEFKTRKFYRGNGIWRDLDGGERTVFITTVIDWLKDRRHDLAFSAVEKEKFKELQWHRHGDVNSDDVKTDWKTCALHLMLSIQKAHQGKAKKKGQTVFIFDRELQEEQDLIELACNPPMWTDTFNKKKKKNDRLDMVVDVPYFADSKAVGLIQVADLFAYLLRHYAELSQGLTEPKYDEELEKVTGWVQGFSKYTLKDSMRWPTKGACSCGYFFNEIGPECLKNFVR